MQEAIEQISASIESLKQSIEALKETKSLFDTYVFPIAAAFLSAVFGGLIAYFAVKRQESTTIEKEKMYAANKSLHFAEKAFLSLLAVKENYYKNISQNPIQRVLSVPPIAGVTQKLELDVLPLTFITPEKESEVSKWNQINQIDTMFHNYNELSEIWNKFEEESLPFKRRLIETYSYSAVATLTINQFFQTVTQREVSIASDLAERALKLTDDLIVDFHDFIESFPKIAKEKINTKRLKKHGKLLATKGRGKDISYLLERIPKLDIQAYADLIGISQEEAKQRIGI